jgi:protein involved in polysaccharide export with SLBB domain
MQRMIERRRTRPLRRTLVWLVPCLLAGGGLAASTARAQSMPAAEDGRGYVTRDELEAYAARVEAANARGATAQQRAEVTALRERLREGDFKVGDKIVLTAAASVSLPTDLAETLNATHTVREGKVLRLGSLGDLSLQGVLRSELDSVVNARVARDLRNVTVRAEPLVQVTVTGPVQVPGFHSVAPDIAITDMLMGSARPLGNADLGKTVVRRSGEEIIGADSLATAIRNGATLDRIDFKSGDEFVVAERKQPRSVWQIVAQTVGIISGLTGLILVLSR